MSFCDPKPFGIRKFASLFNLIVPMNFNLREIASASMILFAVIDIVGSVPIIISLRNKVGHIQSGKATIVAAMYYDSFFIYW